MKKLFSLFIFFSIIFFSFSQNNSKRSVHYVLPEFTEGIILLKNGDRKTGTLNYNALAQNFALKNGDDILALSKYDLYNLDTVYVANRKFFKKDDKIFELLLKSNVELYVEHKCNLKSAASASGGYGASSQTNSSVNVSTIQTQGMTYLLELPETYTGITKKTYFLNKDNELYALSSLNQLKRLYPEKKKEIKKFQKSNKVDFDLPPSVLKLIEYLEAL